MEPPKVPEAPADATDDGAPTAPGDVVEVPTQDPATDAAALYAQCEGRLEQPEAEGECSADADCAPAGCSSERCITKASAEGLMGTCEMLPCFEVVDTCSCQEGRCRWSLK